MDINSIAIENNTVLSRFELPVDGHIAFIDYVMEQGSFALTHTEVPDALGGKGVGRILVTKVLKYVESKNQKIVPYCPFVLAFIKRNPDWERIVAK